MSLDIEEQIRQSVSQFPSQPGVYLMKDKALRIIYVGKAKNLKQRVKQYLTGHDERYQVKFLMERVVQIDYVITSNEKEALLLENSMIKKHKPRYNVFLKDDKTYQGLKITAKHDFPQLLTTRKIRKDGSVYFGPFTSSDALYKVKGFIDQHFQLRTCSDSEFLQRSRPCLEYQIKRCSAPCVGYVTKEIYQQQIEDVMLFLKGQSRVLQKQVKKRMLKAAEDERFEDAARDRDLLDSMASVLEGQKVSHLKSEFVDVIALRRQDDRVGVAVMMVREGQLIDSKCRVFMTLESNEDFLMNFVVQNYTPESFIPKSIILSESVKDTALLESILSERAGHTVKVSCGLRGENKSLLDLANTNLASHFIQDETRQLDLANALNGLQSKLGLVNFPEYIECYDISNISGRYAVASMVTFVRGEKFSNGYRKFKIKHIEGPDDFAMMHETLSRRLKRKDSDWIKPNLIVVDGGKGQLNRVLLALKELNVTGVDVISIAKGKGEGARAKGLWEGKKEEEIYLPNRKNPVLLRRGSPELLLLQHLRDESHRFAISYHRKLRDDAVLKKIKT